MRKLTLFNFITLNGFFKGPGGDISWHQHGGGEDEQEYANSSTRAAHTLVFGRITYQMMAGYWPTPAAATQNPGMAESMNNAQKIVFSRTLDKAGWQNTRLIKGNAVEEMKKLKQEPGGDMTILGSGSIASQLADAGLIDSFELMIDPIALGSGTPLFNGMKNPLKLKLTNTRIFKSGIVLVSYETL